jgi:hypothetical protein
MLIFFIIFFEMAILYFAGPVLLNARQPAPKLGWTGFALMVVGAVMVNVMVFTGGGRPVHLLRAARAHPLYYLGIILFAVGALVAVALLRHPGRRQAREDLRGLGAAGHLRRADGGDHRRHHPAARRGDLHPDLLLVARELMDVDPRSTDGVLGARPQLAADQRRRHGRRSGT